MQAILVRHGETEYNAQGLLQGYAPVPLSPRGRLNDIGHREPLA